MRSGNFYLILICLLLALCINISAGSITAVSYTYAPQSTGPAYYKDNGNTRLTDGYYPQAYPTEVGPWVDAVSAGSAHLIPIFDFGSAVSIDSVHVYAYAGAYGIGYPQQISISFSDDNINFFNAQSYAVSSFSGTKIIDFYLSGLPTLRTGRYARVDIGPTAQTHIFIGEVSFNGGTSNVPEPASWLMILVGFAIFLGKSRKPY